MDQGFIEAVMSRAAELITRGVDDVCAFKRATWHNGIFVRIRM